MNVMSTSALQIIITFDFSSLIYNMCIKQTLVSQYTIISRWCGIYARSITACTKRLHDLEYHSILIAKHVLIKIYCSYVVTIYNFAILTNSLFL